jgi:protein SCO1/2
MRKHRQERIRVVAALLLLIAIGLTLRTVLTLWGGPATAAGKGKESSVWGANYFPNVPLVTHEGKTVRFFDDLIKDKVVAINFIYTSCPDTCPLETARLLEVQRLLGERVGRDVFLYSISIDPHHDTPEVLKHYAEKFQVGPGWVFLTGKEADITLLRQKLGLYIEEIQDGSKDHNLSLIIGNQSTGRWMKRSPFENPYILATQLGSWLHNWQLPRKDTNDYAHAPKLRNISKGESLFRTRCASCHTIGEGDIVKPGTRNIGPDLYNVTTQRDRAWLTRWLAEPDRMLAEKDALALALLAKYNNVPMPNLRLTAVEIQALLTYIADESRRGENHEQAAHH